MRLLVGLDGKQGGFDALALAAALAGAAGGSVTAVTVLYRGPLPVEYALLEDPEAAEAAPLFEQAREVLGEIPFDGRAYGGGSPAGILTRLAEDEGFDAVVVGSPHRGPLGRVLIGNVAGSLLNGAPCDVFVAPKGYAEREPARFATIAVGYDGTPEAKAALRRAEELGGLSSATIEILTVVTPPVAVPVPGGGYAPQAPAEPESVINEAVNAVDPRLGAIGRRLDGPPAEQIAEACAEGVDLLVTGSRGYGPLTRVLLGSVSKKLIGDAPCPVLVVPRP